jgi:phage tail-like protein
MSVGDGDSGAPDGDADIPIEGTMVISGFVTYSGDGFAVVRAAPERGEQTAPTPASNRRYLRSRLPAMYEEQDFAMRFVSAFEEVLDPIVGVLDNLHAHFDPELAPLDILDVATKWLGLRHNEAQPASQLRALVRRAAELGRLRGTYAGLELALRLNFPELPLRVEDGGSVEWAVEGDLPKPRAPSFVVYCDKPISSEDAANVARVIEAVKPVHVSFRLRIKGPRKEAAPA